MLEDVGRRREGAFSAAVARIRRRSRRSGSARAPDPLLLASRRMRSAEPWRSGPSRGAALRGRRAGPLEWSSARRAGGAGRGGRCAGREGGARRRRRGQQRLRGGRRPLRRRRRRLRRCFARQPAYRTSSSSSGTWRDVTSSPGDAAAPTGRSALAAGRPRRRAAARSSRSRWTWACRADEKARGQGLGAFFFFATKGVAAPNESARAARSRCGVARLRRRQLRRHQFGVWGINSLGRMEDRGRRERLGQLLSRMEDRGRRLRARLLLARRADPGATFSS